MINRKKKATAHPEQTTCSQCDAEFKPNADGMTIKHGEYLSSGLKWFCNEDCAEQYTNEKGW